MTVTDSADYALRTRPDGIEELHGRSGFVRFLWDWPPGSVPLLPPFWILGEWSRGVEDTKFCTSSTWNMEKASRIGADNPWFWEAGWRVQQAIGDENDGPACRREYALLLRADGTTIYDVECGS